MSTLDVRPIRTEEIAELLAFYRANFGAGGRVAELFQWRATAPEAANAPWGAWLGSDLVGTVNSVRLRLAGNGELIEAAWQQDSIVSPAARGKGVAKALVDAAAAGWPLVLAKGTTTAMYGLRKSVGFRDAENHTYMFRVLRPFVAGSLYRRLGAPLLYLKAEARRQPKAPPDLVLREVAKFGEQYDDLARQQLSGRQRGPYKTSAYLNWRYVDCPIRKYLLVEATRGGRLAGAAVLRLPTTESGDAWLVDLVASLDDEIIGRELVASSIRAARQRGASLLRTFASSRQARRHLFAAGFVDTPETPHFTFRPQSVGADVVPPSADWSFWHGDGDAELYQ